MKFSLVKLKQKTAISIGLFAILIGFLLPLASSQQAFAAGQNPCPNGKNADGTCKPVNNCPIQGELYVFACPLYAGADALIDLLEGQISEMLTTDTSSIFGSGTPTATVNANGSNKVSAAYFSSWNSFRILAVTFIILVGLFMVISQAIGFGFFDAYNVKKILPRLLFFSMAIATSWFWLRFFIQFFNNLSVWGGGALAYPFQQAQIFGATDPAPWTIVGQWGSLIVAGVIGVLIGPLGILSFAGTILLACMVGFVTLIIRRIALILLVITSPLWVGLFILPNTAGTAKKAWEFFIGLNLMGPAFIILIEAGRIVYKLEDTGAVSSGQKFTLGFVGLVTEAGPLLALPIIARAIGGGTATLMNFANDRSRGAFDRLKNYRSNQIASRKERAKEGELFGSGMIFRGKGAQKANELTRRMGLGARGRFGYGDVGRAAMAQHDNLINAKRAKEARGQSVANNADVLRVQSMGGATKANRKLLEQKWMPSDPNDKEAIAARDRRIDRAFAGARANGPTGLATQIYATHQRGVIQNGFDDAEDVTESVYRATRPIGKITQKSKMASEERAAELLGSINFQSAKSRQDLHLGVGTWLQWQEKYRQEQNGGAAITPRQINEYKILAQDTHSNAELARSIKTIGAEDIAKTAAQNQQYLYEDLQKALDADDRAAISAANKALAKRAIKIDNLEAMTQMYGSDAHAAALAKGEKSAGATSEGRTPVEIRTEISQEIRQTLSPRQPGAPAPERLAAERAEAARPYVQQQRRGGMSPQDPDNPINL